MAMRESKKLATSTFFVPATKWHWVRWVRAVKILTGSLRLGRNLAFFVLLFTMLGGKASGSSLGQVSAGFLFDPEKKHETILVQDGGKTAFKCAGEDFQTVLLKPPVTLRGRSSVDFLIEEQVEPRYLLTTWTPIIERSGKAYQDGGKPRQFLPGMGTPPLFPGDEMKALGSVRPREGDKVGLTCDRDEGTIAVSVNGIDHGIMATNLPKEKDLFFAVDLSDEGQRLKILDERHSA